MPLWSRLVRYRRGKAENICSQRVFRLLIPERKWTPFGGGSGSRQAVSILERPDSGGDTPASAIRYHRDAGGIVLIGAIHSVSLRLQTIHTFNWRHWRKFNMPKTATILACSLVASAFSFSAQARGFCGQGFHHGPYGACVRNGVPTRLVVTPDEGPLWPTVWCPTYGYYYNDRYGRCLPTR